MADDDVDMAAALLGEDAEETTPVGAPSALEAGSASSLDFDAAVYDISVEVIAVLGTALMPISQVLKLGRGAVVQLERLVEEDIDLYANNILIAKGEVVVTEDRLGVSLSKIVKQNIGKL
tara:strand:- start:122 stop:481 length:360 start_codon:yes stop_codon:yes gene_type:complete